MVVGGFELHARLSVPAVYSGAALTLPSTGGTFIYIYVEGTTLFSQSGSKKGDSFV